MRGRYENGTRFWGATDAFVDIDTLLVDRNRANLRARCDKRKAGQGVSWIFDPDCLVPPLHDADDDIKGLLRARGDDDLLGVAPHSARSLEVGAHGLAQFEHAVRIGVAQVMSPEGPQCARAEFSP